MAEKKVLVAGTGKSGICAAQLLARNNETVILFDENTELTTDSVKNKLEDCKNIDKIEIFIGSMTDDLINQCKYMVISPGIAIDKPFVNQVRDAGLPIWSEIELAYHYEKDDLNRYDKILDLEDYI